MRQPVSPADGDDLGPFFQKTALIKNVDQILFPFGKKNRDQRNDHFSDAENNKNHPAQDNDEAETFDKIIIAERAGNAEADNNDPYKRGEQPSFETYAGI